MPKLPTSPKRPWIPVAEKRPYKQHAARTSDYDSAEWKALSLQVRREQPICQEPGCTKPSKATDHISPVRAGGDMWARANLQALCWSHHQAKSAAEGRTTSKRG
jgi:5-methylcytosine-specific restriction endonuclease McrA